MLLRSGGACAKQGEKLSSPIEGREIIESAHVGVANVDLRHGSSAGLLDHEISLSRVEVDANFLDLLHTALL